MPTDEEIKAKVEAIIASGVKTITVGDKTMTYRDQAELEKILAKLDIKINPQRPYSVASSPYYCKGL